MPQTSPAGQCRLPLLLLLALAACAPEAPTPPAPERPAAARPTPDRARLGADSIRATRPAPPRPDTAQVRAPAPLLVFDTLEAPPSPPPPRPPPERLPRPDARPLPPPSRSAASCDVRPAEDYCFAYIGTGWTPAEARRHCAAAPNATFRPAAPCPTAERIATCTFRRPSDPAHETLYTTYAPADLTLARLACPGEFTVVE